MTPPTLEELVRDCGQLQDQLLVVQPNHELNQFSRCSGVVADWEQSTNQFYQRFAATKKSWRAMQRHECLLAWFNFRTELVYALTIARANPPRKQVPWHKKVATVFQNLLRS